MKFSWFVLFSINIILYNYLDIEISFSCFVVFMIYLLYDLGLFSSISFTKCYFNECIIYFYDFTGDYSNIYSEYDKIDATLRELKLQDDEKFMKFGVYYDDPKLVSNRNSCRAVIGILTYDLANSNEESILRKGYFRKKMPKTESVISSFPFVNSFSIGIAVYKYYSRFYSLIEDFKKFKVGTNLSNSVVELYKNNTIEFYVPLRDFDEFLLHKSFKKQNKTD